EYETVAAIVLDPSVPSPQARRPEIPDDLDAIVRKGLAKNRNARFATAADLARELETWLVGEGEAVGERGIAAWLAELFPAQRNRVPELDRTPLAHLVRKPSRDDQIAAQLLAAEAEHDAEIIERVEARRRTMIAIVLLLLGAAAIAVIAWVAARPRG